MKFGADESLHSLGNLFSRTVSRFQMPELGTSLQYKWLHQPGGSNASFLSSPLPLFGISFSFWLSSPPHPPLLPNYSLLILQDKYGGTVKEEAKGNLGRKKEYDFISHSFCPFCTLWHLTLPSGSKGVCGTLLWQHKRSFMIWCWPFFFFFLM